MNNKKKLAILAALIFIGSLVFLFYGVNESNAGYFLSLRSKKLLSIALVSYCIGYSSVVFQTISNNKILTPSVMGLDSLYMFVQTVIVFFFQKKSISPISGEQNFLLSIIFMLGFSTLLYKLLFQGEKRNIYFLLLAGTILGTLFSGLSSFMQVLLDPNEFLILQGKMFASFSNVNESLLGVSVIICLICLAFSYKDHKKLDAISLGVDQAINLGVDYKILVKKNLIIVAVLVSVSTALVGPVTFLGILVASLARSLTGTYKHNYLLLAATLIGMFFLVYGLFIVEKVFALETTLSVIINFFGGIYFIYSIIKEGRI